MVGSKGTVCDHYSPDIESTVDRNAGEGMVEGNVNFEVSVRRVAGAEHGDAQHMGRTDRRLHKPGDIARKLGAPNGDDFRSEADGVDSNIVIPPQHVVLTGFVVVC